MNTDDNPLRVKNHWHTGQVEPAWNYAHSRARGIYPKGRSWLGGAAALAFVHAPFHQLAGQERQTEESNSIPAPVPTAPPSAQRSWTDRPECGEYCYLNSFSSLYAVWDGATLKVSTLIYFSSTFIFLFTRLSAEWVIEELQSCAASDSPSALVAHQNKPVIAQGNWSWIVAELLL